MSTQYKKTSSVLMCDNLVHRVRVKQLSATIWQIGSDYVLSMQDFFIPENVTIKLPISHVYEVFF